VENKFTTWHYMGNTNIKYSTTIGTTEECDNIPLISRATLHQYHIKITVNRILRKHKQLLYINEEKTAKEI